MAQFYQVRLKAEWLRILKDARDKVRNRLGNRRVGVALTNLSAEDAGDLATELLTLLDAIDAVLVRAKPVD